MANNNQSGYTRPFIAPLTARVHQLRSSSSFRRLETAARCNPLISLFIGTFLTASTIPFTIFFLFITGAFLLGILALTAFQSGALFFATVILLACLVAPFCFSTGLALIAFLGLSTLERIRRFIHPLDVGPVVRTRAGRFGYPVELLENVATRIRAINNSDNHPDHSTGIPSNVHPTSDSREGDENDQDGLSRYQELAHMSCNAGKSRQEKERAQGSAFNGSRYGSELRECAERHIRRRSTLTSLPEPDRAVQPVLSPGPHAATLPLTPMHGHLTLAVNAFIGENQLAHTEGVNINVADDDERCTFQTEV